MKKLIYSLLVILLLYFVPTKAASFFDDGIDYNSLTVESINAMIKQGADINEKGEFKNTPLMMIVQENKDLDVIRALMIAGANINSKNKAGETAFHWAVMYNPNIDIITYLMQGVNINQKNKDGGTPLMYAAYWIFRSH